MSLECDRIECPMCESGIVRPAKTPYKVQFRNRQITIPDADVMACGSCGEVFFASGQSDALQRRAADALRAEMGLLSGARMAAFRKEHGLTQAQFERALGAPPKSIARWEISCVFQSGTVDTFLRVLIAHPALLEELMQPARSIPNG